MSLVTAAPPDLQPMVAFILDRNKETYPDTEDEGGPEAHPMGMVIMGAVGLLSCDACDKANALRRDWAREILADIAYLWASHPDYRPQWLPQPARFR